MDRLVGGFHITDADGCLLGSDPIEDHDPTDRRRSMREETLESINPCDEWVPPGRHREAKAEYQ